ncbi:MAG: inositol monophosphatase family protein [Anaerolineaceae bacterium]
MADPSPNTLLTLASELATEAGLFLRERAPLVRELIDTKSSPTDMVTEVDRAAEALIVGRILTARPNDGLLGEEGASRAGSSGVRWVIDPLDGTTSYVYGYPAYSVSIAAELRGETVAGVVYDAAHGLLYSAARGRGAFCDERPITVSGEARVGHALCGTGFGYDPARRAKQGAMVAQVLPRIRDIRRGGSAALDLCWVASGRLDAYFEQGLNAWDMAAGVLIVQEAGGVTGWAEGLTPKCLVAANPALFGPIESMLNALG